jgi:hypothetical protein
MRSLKKEKIPTTPAYPDCVGLVGESPKLEPHNALLFMEKDSENSVLRRIRATSHRGREWQLSLLPDLSNPIQRL